MADVTKQQLMFSLIEVWRKGEQPQQEFCKEKDLDYPQFQDWLRRYKQLNSPGEPPSGFTQIKLKSTISHGSIELELELELELDVRFTGDSLGIPAVPGSYLKLFLPQRYFDAL